MALTREQKAELYDKYLREYDEKARQVSLIESKFDLSKEDQNKITALKKEMTQLQQKAFKLGDYHQ
jgi:hypothetical protein